jgi:hypothetical protein
MTAVQKVMRETKLRAKEEGVLFETPCSNGMKFEFEQLSSYSISMFKAPLPSQSEG